MSCRQSRLSKGMEAFISRINADGPSAKRPPHMLLELPLRLLIVCLLALLAAGCDRQKPPEAQGAAPGAEAKVEGKFTIDRSGAGRAAPEVSFKDPDGEDVTIAAFEGKPLLVNLWATWCAPCIAEMPALDLLAARRGDVQVLAVSQDSPDAAEKVADFFRDRKLAKLEPYMDPDIALMTGLGAANLPTTILYDASGKEVWRVSGAMDWTGEEAAKLLAEVRP